MLAIYKKELKSYFTSMIGYVFMALFLVIIGLYFVVYNLFNQFANFEYVLSAISFIFILLIPILTMRLMAEDKRQKTDQLLYTSPLPVSHIIIGKYLAVFTVFLAVVGLISFYPFILLQYGNVPLKVAYSAIFGFTLLGGAYIAIGLFISSLTESQVVAAVVSFVVMLLTALMDGIVTLLPTDNKSALYILSALVIIFCVITFIMMHNITVTIITGATVEIIITAIYFLKPTLFDGALTKIFGWLSVVERFNNFITGLLDLSSVVYYLSLIGIFIFLTVQSIKKHRFS